MHDTNINQKITAVVRRRIKAGATVGSLVWGAFAGRLGVNFTLVTAGIGLIISLAAEFLFPLRGCESLDLTPAVHCPEPGLLSRRVYFR
jgi:hypothetical protein